MARDADFWEAMYRAVIRRLGEITDSDDDHRTLMFEAVTRAHIEASGRLLVDRDEPEAPTTVTTTRWYEHWEDGASREHRGMREDDERFARQQEDLYG